MRETLINNHGQANFYNVTVKQTVYNNYSRPIANSLSSGKSFSIEVCPNRCLDTKLLPKLNANFCSVTWLNPDLHHVDRIPAILLAEQLCSQGYNVLLHLAGRNQKKDKLLELLNVVKNVGVRNILALKGESVHVVETDDKKCDFPYAVDLVRFIRSNFGNYFSVGVTGYPEKHVEGNVKEIRYLKEKVSAGADFIITQASYDYEAFKKFAKLCKTVNINVPIIPGLFVISSYTSLMAMSTMCHVPLTPTVLAIAAKNKHNDTAIREFGIHYATLLTRNILNDTENLFGGFHIFSLNNLHIVKQVLKRLGLFKPSLEYPLKINK